MKRGIKAISICLISLWMGFVMALPAAAGQARPPVQKPIRIKRPDIQAGLYVQLEMALPKDSGSG